jgi:hypothetical protein
MKKTLLCFLFLFATNLFYAQVGTIEHCFGDNFFDLTVNNSLLLGNLNPAETTISFHLSQDDANNNANAILQPTQYNGSAPSKTIYARIDNNGTVTTNYFDLKIYESLTITLSLKTDVSCYGMNNGRIFVPVSGGKLPYAYSVNNGPYTVYNSGSNLQLDNLHAGMYIIQAKDALGCLSQPHIVQIDQPNVLMANTTVENQNIIMVNATGGRPEYSYSLNNGNYQNSPYFSNLQPGTYHVFVKDANNCIFQAPTTIIYPPLVAAANVSPVSCNGLGMIIMTASGGNSSYAYVYSIDGYNFSPVNVFNNLPAGNYLVRVRDSQNNEITVPVTVPNLKPILALSILQDATCAGESNGSVKLSSTGGNGKHYYSLDSVSFQTDNTFNNLAAGTYTATVKDDFSCISDPINFTITEPKQLNVEAAVVKLVDCLSNATITATASGGLAPYQFSIDGIIYSDKTTFANVAPGTYSIYAKDQNGCVSFKSITVNQYVQSPSTVTVTQISCINEKGSVTVQGTSGKLPYQYSLNGQAFGTNNVFTNLVPGNHTITTKDNNGCSTTDVVTIISFNPLAISAISKQATCYGSADGSIEINTHGGKFPFTYSLRNASGIPIAAPQNSNIFNNLPAGVYNAEVQDANACLVSLQMFVVEPAILHSTVNVDNQTVTINATGGSGKYLYSIEYFGNRQSSNIFTNVSFGDHEAYVIDENGCFNLVYFTVNPPSPLINGKSILNIEFTPGQTLGDLVLEGQNIKWYSSPNSTSGKSRKTAETTLPLTTVLVDGVTYYASQTINGIESKERLAVTAKVNGSLSTEDFVLPNFRYYPNPVQHVLNISNSSTIEDIEIISVSGKSILSKKINNTQSEIDLSNIASGFYLLKVKSEGKTKTIKIVKK